MTAAARTRAATALDGAFETSPITRVSGSRASQDSVWSVASPSTASWRSRPPVPMPCETPPPSRWMRLETS